MYRLGYGAVISKKFPVRKSYGLVREAHLGATWSDSVKHTNDGGVCKNNLPRCERLPRDNILSCECEIGPRGPKRGCSLLWAWWWRSRTLLPPFEELLWSLSAVTRRCFRRFVSDGSEVRRRFFWRFVSDGPEVRRRCFWLFVSDALDLAAREFVSCCLRWRFPLPFFDYRNQHTEQAVVVRDTNQTETKQRESTMV